MDSPPVDVSDVSLLPVALPTRNGLLARTLAAMLPLFFIAGLGALVLLRGSGAGGATARGFSEAIVLNVAPATAGRLSALEVTVGQIVKAGDVVGRLDARAVILERQKAEAERALLEAELRAEMSREDDNVMRAEVWRVRVMAGAREDEAELAALDKELERLNGLLGQNLVKASEVEPRVRQREALAARVGTFARARSAGQAGLDDNRGDKVGPAGQAGPAGQPGQAGPAGQARPARKGLRGADRHSATVTVRTEPLRESLRVKEAELAQIDLKLSTLVLQAPADGVVSVINRRPGEFIGVGEAAVVLVAHRAGRFEAYLSQGAQGQAGVPTLGAAVRIGRPGLFSKSVPGRIVEIAPAIAELPARLRASPQVPVWGRRVVVEAESTGVAGAEGLLDIAPGDEVRVRLR